MVIRLADRPALDDVERALGEVPHRDALGRGGELFAIQEENVLAARNQIRVGDDERGDLADGAAHQREDDLALRAVAPPDPAGVETDVGDDERVIGVPVAVDLEDLSLDDRGVLGRERLEPIADQRGRAGGDRQHQDEGRDQHAACDEASHTSLHGGMRGAPEEMRSTS